MTAPSPAPSPAVAGAGRLLVRLPNWLGDVVMSAAFLRALRAAHPHAEIHLICKDALAALVPLLPGGPWAGVHPFSKAAWPGALGAWRFGWYLRRVAGPFTAYFSLPASASAALVGWGSGAARRVGFRGEAGWLFSEAHARPPASQHRALAYAGLALGGTLLAQPAGALPAGLLPPLPLSPTPDPLSVAVVATVLVNVNSEAQSRRLPVPVALRVLAAVRTVFPQARLALIGAPKERAYVQAVLDAAPVAWRPMLHNAAGTTDLPGLAAQLAGAALVVSSDSGPAHLAAALATPTVVLFGQGFESQTAPAGPAPVQVVRAPGARPCAGCPPNRCRFGAAPPCLTEITEAQLVGAIRRVIVWS